MRVFISWSGERSQVVARALRDWFPLVLHYVEPWMSQEDIKAGDRWANEVARELNNCQFGVICLTRDNLMSSWLLFEAGALAKSIEDGRVVPLLLDLDVRDVSFPLGQFQSKKLDKVGVRDLIASINSTAASALPESRVEALFSSLWSKLEEDVSKVPKLASGSKVNRSQDEILEELVSGVRSLEVQIRNSSDMGPDLKRKRRFRAPSDLMALLMGRLSSGPNDPINAMLISSTVRDEVPWLYDMAVELYRSSRLEDRDIYRANMRQFSAAVDLLMRDQIGFEFGFDPMVIRNLRLMMHEQELFSDREIELDERGQSGFRRKP